ncbi:hypothetical protein JNUCC23_23240 (plasmid) [Peribacillus sp. JNUCC 23]
MRDFNELDQELISKMPKITPTTTSMSEGFADIIFFLQNKKWFNSTTVS